MAFYTDGVVPWNSLDDNTRGPLSSELEAGYPCGEADQALFNFTAGYPIGQIYNLLLESGITPDFRDLTQMTQALMKIFVIDTPVVKTVYGPGADFADLNAAHVWASRFRIVGNGSLTLNIPAGKFTSSTAQFFSHVDDRKVTIAGADLIGGGFPSEANFAATGSSTAQRAADKATNLAMLRARFATELAFTGPAGLTISGLGVFRNVLVTSDGTAVDGIAVLNSGNLSLQQVVSLGFGGRGIVTAQGRASLTNVASLASGTTGISFEEGTNCLLLDRLFAFGNAGNGIASVGASNIVAQSGGGHVLVSKGNGVDGVNATGNGRIQTSGTNLSKAERNGGVGWHAIESGKIRAPLSLANNNAGYAYLSEQDSFVDASSTTGTGNGAGYGATDKSFVNAVGGTVGATSPTANTVGNSLSFVKA